MPLQNLQISIKHADVLKFACNLFVLKDAQAWHGADYAVAKALNLAILSEPVVKLPAPGNFVLVPSQRKLKADAVLFEGVETLGRINYSKIRQFGRSAILHVHEAMPEARHIAMTIHGVNFGMDERECFLSQLAGILETLEDETILPRLAEISIVEKNEPRAERLKQILAESNYKQRRSVANSLDLGAEAANSQNSLSEPLANAGLSKNEKPHIFVAMPFNDEMEDVFIFGVQGAVQEAGYLCERVDMATFTGDIVERIKSRIESANLVIADLTGSNANVYLEVGYAWGRKVSTLLICRKIDELKFDVKGHRCVAYSSINDLRKKLAEELKTLL
jgi:hypothetical protein